MIFCHICMYREISHLHLLVDGNFNSPFSSIAKLELVAETEESMLRGNSADFEVVTYRADVMPVMAVVLWSDSEETSRGKPTW